MVGTTELNKHMRKTDARKTKFAFLCLRFCLRPIEDMHNISTSASKRSGALARGNGDKNHI